MNRETSYAKLESSLVSINEHHFNDPLVADCFLATVRCASFKQAARALNLQPAVLRKKLELLEDCIGAPLLLYRSNQLVLTQAGKQVHQYIKSGHKHCPDIVPGERSLRIGIAECLMGDLINRALIGFARDNASLCLDIVPLKNAQQVCHEDLDLALWTVHPGQDNAHRSHRLRARDQPVRIHYAPFIASRYARTGGPSFAADNLDDYRLVHVEDFQASETFAAWNRLISQRSRGVTYVRDPALAYHMIKGGAGIGLLPDYTGQLDRTLRPVPDLLSEPIQQHVLLSTHVDNQTNSNVIRLAEQIDSLFSQRRDWLS